MLENIQSYISVSAQSSETFNEYYLKYMMEVQDNDLSEEMNKLFGSPSINKLIEIDREANKLYTNTLRGV